jgi:hypothetical protein
MRVLYIYRRLDAEPTGLGKALVLLVVCALASLVLWYPLGLPSELVRNVIAQPTVICRFENAFAAGFNAGTPRMYFCSLGVAILTMAGPVALIVLAYVFRGTLRRIIGEIAGRSPVPVGWLLAPLAATLVFELAWSGAHYTTAWFIGFLPQTLFPAVVGLFTYAVGQWGSAAQARLVPVFDLRDRYPASLRVVAAFVLTFVVSFILTAENRVSLTAIKEQLIVIVGLVVGFVMLAPRRGDVFAGVKDQIGIAATDARTRIAAARAGRR